MMLPILSQDAFAAALLDSSLPVPEGVTTARGASDPARFAVYRNNVFVGLTNALAKCFPVVERLVGRDFFAGMARIYAGQERPASPLLFAYGDSFPDFVAAFGPARTVPYLADVARIEAAWMRAYHAADMTPLNVADVAGIDPAAIEQIRLVKHPSTTLVRSPYPVGSIWAAHQGATVEPLHASPPEAVLVVRPEMDVLVHILPTWDAPFAAALLRGETLRAAAEDALAADPSFDFGAALVGLVSLGAFAALASQEEEPT
jgi:hypothetical protein